MEDFGGSHRAEIYKCIIYNRSVQHLFPDLYRIIKTELNLLSTNIKELQSDAACDNFHDPYLKARLYGSSRDVPPLNRDAISRLERKEWNVTDVRSMACKAWIKSEINHLVSAVACHARRRRIDILEHQREVQLSRIANLQNSRHSGKDNSKTSSHRSSSTAVQLSNSMKQIEQQLRQHNELPAKPPAWLVSAITCAYFHEPSDITMPNTTETNQMRNVRREFWERRIFRRYRGPRFMREYTVKMWLDLLFNAEDLLTDAEWAEMANFQFRDSASKENLRLMWVHRVKPNCNLSEWTASEDAQLKALVGRLGRNGHWESIAEQLNTGRSAFACFQRWRMNLDTDLYAERPWTVAEDSELMDIVKRLLDKYPPPLIEWKVVASFHRTRTARECMNRAAAICPAFAHTNASRLVDAYVPLPARPFSPDEDLQLLIAVQRYGTAGGFVGTGGGVGLGSWALVTTALPGRSLFSCQKRYVQLCDQFQPWAYAEDRRLYQLLLKHKGSSGMENMANYPASELISCLLPHFPGRSTLSIRQRGRILLRWASVWSSWRRTMSLFTFDSQFGQELDVVKSLVSGVERTQDQDGACKENNKSLSDLHQLLLQSPFTSQFIIQLKENGIANPEVEALRLLASWKCSPSADTQSHSHPGAGASEFSQLLDDLASGVLVPRPLVVSSQQLASTSGPDGDACVVGEADEQWQATSSNQEAPELSSSSLSAGTAISVLQAKRMMANIQLKHVLAGPIRCCLSSLLRKSELRQTTTRRRGGESVASATSAIVSPSAGLGQSSSSTTARPSGSQRVPGVASALLSDGKLFWRTFEAAMVNPKVTDRLVRLGTVSKLREVAPLVSALMFRHARRALSTSCRAPTRFTSLPPSRRRPLKTTYQVYRHRLLVARMTAARRHHLQRRLASLPAPLVVDSGGGGRRAQSASLSLGDRELGHRRHSEEREVPAQADNAVPGPSSGFCNQEKVPVIPSISKRFKLFQIKRLLRTFGTNYTPKANAYAIAPIAMMFPKSKLTAAETSISCSHYCPPLLRALPTDLAARLVLQPKLVASRCGDMVSACLSNSLGLPEALERLTATSGGPVAASSGGSDRRAATARYVLPPNYATILAWKSLLVHAPALARMDGSHYEELASLRRISLALSTGEGFEREIVEKWNDPEQMPPLDSLHFSLTPNSPADSLALSHGLSMMLLPALLSSIPTETFVKAAARVWNTAMSELPADPSSSQHPLHEMSIEVAEQVGRGSLKQTRTCLANRRLRIRTSQVVKRACQRSYLQRRYYHHRGRMPRCTRPDWGETVEVSLSTGGRQARSIRLVLPSQVRLLTACNFQPVSIFHASSM